jgi:hypothetical protein
VFNVTLDDCTSQRQIFLFFGLTQDILFFLYIRLFFHVVRCHFLLKQNNTFRISENTKKGKRMSIFCLNFSVIVDSN